MQETVQISQEEKNVKNPENLWSFLNLAEAVLALEPERTREIIKKRFGLFQKKPQTLEKIGQEYDITRERVRQIISDVIKRIAKKCDDASFKMAEDRIVFTINENNGIIKEQELIEKSEKKEAGAIVFFGMASSKIEITDGGGIFEKSWVVNCEVVEKVKKIEQVIGQIFEKNRNLLTDKELLERIFNARIDLKNKYSKEEILSFAKVICSIEKNIFGKWGMKNWEEVTPKGTREKIQLILKEKKKPLHFSEIAKLIDEYKLSKRKVHLQTVHNELIKDERFVLIGRGIYAMREWGYEKGTIKDVLENILKNSQKPLEREEIIEKVLSLRKVKKATVMINLNNSKLFMKQKNAYFLKK
jgi:DNA-directed RNA polymerase delta subunit